MKSAWQSTSATHNDIAPSKPTRLSLACFSALAFSVATPAVAVQPIMTVNNRGQCHAYAANANHIMVVNERNGCNRVGGVSSLVGGQPDQKINIDINKVSTGYLFLIVGGDNTKPTDKWADINLKQATVRDTATFSGNIQVEVKGLKGENVIKDLAHGARKLHLKGADGSTLQVQKLRQDGTDSISQIFDGATVNNFTLSNGNSYQRGGTVTTLNIRGGSFYQGYKDDLTPGERDGTIGTINLQDGVFQQGKGSVTTLTQNGGTLDQRGGTISTLTQSSGTTTQEGGTIENFTQNGGTATQNGATSKITTLTQNGGAFTQKNGQITTLTQSGGTFNQNGGTIDNFTQNGGTFNQNGGVLNGLTQKNGASTIQGKVTSVTLEGGSLTNKGEITKLISKAPEQTTRTAFFNAQPAASTHKEIINDKTIDDLDLQQPTSVINNPGATINKFTVSSGSSSINTLNGVGFDASTGLSTIIINSSGSLSVDTLSVKLKGNSAVQRVDIKGNNPQQGSFSVKEIKIERVDGSFDPTKPIATNLRDFVTTEGQKFIKEGEKIEFSAGEDLEEIGVKIDSTGNPTYSAQDSISADMTSLLIRQNLRRKMLIDTYLAEQSRRSLKNKERRTKERIARAAIGDSKAQYDADMAIYKREKEKWDKLASSKENKALIAKYEKEHKAYEKALKAYEKDKAKWDKLSDKDKAKLAANKGIDMKAPIEPKEPKAPTKPNLKPNHKDYKKAMAAFTKAQNEHKTALAQYEKDLAKYKLDKEKWDKESQKLAKAGKSGAKAPVAPKEPTKPAILASKPEMPIKPELSSIAADLYADAYGVKGDFFIRAFGSVGTHSLNDGSQTSSWSSGTLFGANWDLKLGNSQGNIGFYGGYEYLHNGYKRTDINAQGHTGFVGLRFSHLFARSKLAGFYYIADINGGYTDISLHQTMNRQSANALNYAANIGSVNIGSSIRLGSAVYLSGTKSMLFPSIGVGVEAGSLGNFEMRTQKADELRYGGLAQPYAVTYGQLNLNYYQELGRKFSTTLGGGVRQLFNTEIGINPTLNGKTYSIDEATGRSAVVSIAPFFYQGTFVVNYHTDKAGNFSAGYVAVGGELGITHNFSARWHYFF